MFEAALLKRLFSAQAMEMSSGLDKRVCGRRRAGCGVARSGGRERVLMRRAQCARALHSRTPAIYVLRYEFK